MADPLDASETESDSNGLPSSLKIRQTLEFGCSYVAEALWERLGLKKTLCDIQNACGTKAPYERAIFAMVTNRLRDLLPQYHDATATG